MKFRAKIVYGKLQILGASEFFKKNEGKLFDIEIKKRTRTTLQNNSLHLFCDQLGNELNDKGYDERAIIRAEVFLSWTGYLVKERLWRPFQMLLLGKKSTKMLHATGDIDLVYDNLNRAIVERTKGVVEVPPWPCEEELINKMNNEEVSKK